jgi:steroid 5-alpha reductase family enzyme
MLLSQLVALIAIALALAGLMTGAWLVQQRTQNSGWVDTIWTFGLGGIGAIAAIAPLPGAPGPTTRAVIVAALVLAWSVRLGSHIAMRTVHITDDPRYAKLAKGWGDDAPRQMFWFLQRQAYGTIPLAYSVFLAAHNPAPNLRLQDVTAIAVLVIGIVGEGVSDRQLRNFQSDPANKGRICDAGLWGWSRHPNYFFEWFGWLAYPLFAIDLTGLYPWGFLALMAPAFMYYILVHLTGVPPLEEHMARTRGAAFRDYASRTNAFFPAPPRSSP